jgi:hypothetical protein
LLLPHAPVTQAHEIVALAGALANKLKNRIKADVFIITFYVIIKAVKEQS